MAEISRGGPEPNCFRDAEMKQKSMSLTYAIPDLHGRLDLLEGAVDKIAHHSAGKPSTLVTLGDYVDKGPDSRRVIEKLMAWRSDTMRLVALKGNHEAMMWEVCSSLADLDWWIRNGGGETLKSYGSSKGANDVRIVPRAHRDWIGNLALMHVDQHRIFVHAALDPGAPLDRQSEQTLLWKRYPVNADVGHCNRHVVHGHHAMVDAPIVKKHRTNLDAWAWKTGRLVIGVFENDRPGGASEFIEIVVRTP
jgi:serine/threonine protein phosphatase 1